MEKETSKKKLIRVDGPGLGVGGYKIHNVNFAWVSNPDIARRQVTTLMTCREFVNRVIWAYHTGRADDHYRPDRSKGIEFDPEKMRLLVVHDPSNFDIFRDRLFNGKGILNIIEDKMGWERSKITTVKHSEFSNAWLITGPKEWMQNGPTMSIATMFLRIACYFGKGSEFAVDNFEELEKAIEILAPRERARYEDGAGNKDVGRHLAYLSKRKLRIFLENYEYIWKGVGIKEAYPDNDDAASNFRPYNGLEFFFTQGGCTYSKKIAEAMARMRKLITKT
jgi:hypothetical protein